MAILEISFGHMNLMGLPIPNDITVAIHEVNNTRPGDQLRSVQSKAAELWSNTSSNLSSTAYYINGFA